MSSACNSLSTSIANSCRNTKNPKTCVQKLTQYCEQNASHQAAFLNNFAQTLNCQNKMQHSAKQGAECFKNMTYDSSGGQ